MKTRYYHWVIVLLVFAVMLIYGGFINAMGVFTIPVTGSLGISRGSFSLLTVTRGLAGFLSSLVTGLLFQRFGYKKCLLTSLLLTLAALVMLGCTDSPAILAVGYGLLGIANGACTTVGAVYIIKNWFCKHQGLFLGIVTMATGLGGSLMSLVLTKIIVASSWRFAFFFAALLTGVLLLMCFAIKNRPSEMGLVPYGEGTQAKQDAPNTQWMGYTLKETAGKPQFYLMTVGALTMSVCVYLSSNTLIAHLQDTGSSPTDSAAFYSLLMLALSVVKLAGGWLIDRIGARWVTVLCCAFAGLGQLLFAGGTNLTMNYIGLFCFAIGLLSTTILLPLLIVPLFGYQAFGMLNGIFMAMISLGSMLAPPIADLLYDRIGSYTPIYTAAGIINFVLIGLFGLLFLLCKKEEQRFLQNASRSQP